MCTSVWGCTISVMGKYLGKCHLFVKIVSKCIFKYLANTVIYIHVSLCQRFSNFLDHGPLFSSGIVGGPPPLGLPPLHFRNPGRWSTLSLPPLPFLPSALQSPSFPFPIPFPSLPLRSRHLPPIAARGSGGALKLPQRVRAEPGRQTHSDAF